MNRFPDLRGAPEAFTASVVKRLRSGRPVRRSVPGGWLHMDRVLPFLCVYRHPPEAAVAGAECLVLSQAAHLSVSGAPELRAAVGGLVAEIGQCLSERFGSFLVVELWVNPGGTDFRIHAPLVDPATTVAALADALKRVDVLGDTAPVESVDDPAPSPPGLSPLLTGKEQRAAGLLTLGLEVPGFFLGPDGRPFPGVLRRLQHDLARALQRTVFEFTTVQTNFRPQDFRAVGPRRLLNATRQVDRRLAHIAGQIDYLVAITPINAEAAWTEFRNGGYGHQDPTFHYRPLTVDPDLLKRALYTVPLERVEDPTLAGVFRAKRQELDRQVSMLEDRNSDAFLPTSLQLYGSVDDDLLGRAEELLAEIQRRRPTGPDPDSDDEDTPPLLDAEAFAALARAELDRYRATAPGLAAKVTIREDIPGVLVSHGDLLVGAEVRIPAARADALVQHEVGTHIVTDVNGAAQPLHLLRVGLPGYEETQEGLAVLAEYIVGGLTAARLATLGARVVAVHRRVAGATFTRTFHDLRERGLSPKAAFRVTLRVYRSGGLTKDAVYLRGLHLLLRHLADGRPLDPLLVGKLSLDYVPVVQELQWRGVLTPPLLKPRWLTDPHSPERLEALRAGRTILDLVPEATA